MSKEYYTGFSRVSWSRLRKISAFMLACIFLSGWHTPLLHAEQPGILEGRILAIDNTPVSGGEVYIFDSPDVKRPADFISNRTTGDGLYQVQVPPGDYWALAVFRQDGSRFGPLASGDKHSGEPVALEITAGMKRAMDFVVMNLREAARKHQKKSADLIRVTGKLVNASGAPVVQAYAMAHKMEQFGNLPDYISAWTDEKGDYVLYLPAGRYYLGASIGFPPAHGYTLYLDKQFAVDTESVDLVVDREKK